MKWKNRGHEFDEIGNKMKKKYSQTKGVWIWGAGIFGVDLGKKLLKFDALGGYVDQNPEKQQAGCLGKKVISIQKYLQQEKGMLVIAAGKKNTPLMAKQLQDAGLKLNEDFFLLEDYGDIFERIFYVYCLGISYLELAQIVLTERCTLKCNKCAHACYSAINKNDMTFEDVCRTADIFFSKVDYIEKFVLIGGEPLLYKYLADVISYIGENYRMQMKIFSIETNGTILPNDILLHVMNKYDVLYEVSDYTESIPKLKEKYVRLENLLNERKVNYIFYKHSYWIDYGLDGEKKHMEEEKVLELFDKCKTPCREVKLNRFYFCVQARTISDNLNIDEIKDDFLDLMQLGENGKKELLEFDLGYCEKGYLEMCRRCNGSERVNKYKIAVAEQMNETRYKL